MAKPAKGVSFPSNIYFQV